MKRTITERFDAQGRLLERVVVETDELPSVIGWPNSDTFTAPNVTDHYTSCPCNPANGGSGICGCVLGGSQITCSALS